MHLPRRRRHDFAVVGQLFRREDSGDAGRFHPGEERRALTGEAEGKREVERGKGTYNDGADKS